MKHRSVEILTRSEREVTFEMFDSPPECVVDALKC